MEFSSKIQNSTCVARPEREVEVEEEELRRFV